MKSRIIIVLITLCGILGCIPEDSSQEIEDNSLDSLGVGSSYKEYQDTTTSGVITNGDYSISFQKSIRIDKLQGFPYYLDNGKDKSNGNIFTFEFLDDTKYKIYLRESGFQWIAVYTLLDDWSAELTLEGTKYKNRSSIDNASEVFNLELFINNNKELIHIILGKRKFTKKPTPVQRSASRQVNEEKTSITNLSYGADSHEVVVKANQTLTSLVNLYNKENNTLFSNQDILKKNPKLRSRKNNYLVKGEVIEF